MATSGHSFRVKQETKQPKLLPNVITIHCSTWSEEMFIYGLISNCKRSIVFCDIPSACFPACLTTNVIINININIRRASQRTVLSVLLIPKRCSTLATSSTGTAAGAARLTIRQGESKAGMQVVVCPVTPGNHRYSHVNTTPVQSRQYYTTVSTHIPPDSWNILPL